MTNLSARQAAFGKWLTLAFLTLTLSWKITGQQAPVLGSFLVSESKGYVYLSWQLLAGGTCNGTWIHRSTDGENYTEIGEIGGICGNITEPESYEFIDSGAFPNQRNYYRLELGKGNFTTAVYIDLIDLDDRNYSVRPNPVTGRGRIYFLNPGKDNYAMEIYNIQGQLIQHNTTTSDFYDIPERQLAHGLYIFRIFQQNKQPAYSGKFLFLP